MAEVSEIAMDLWLRSDDEDTEKKQGVCLRQPEIALCLCVKVAHHNEFHSQLFFYRASRAGDNPSEKTVIPPPPPFPAD